MLVHEPADGPHVDGHRTWQEPADAGRCLEAGCGAGDAIQCTYVDRRERRCLTHWCSDHIALVDGRPCCRRHAGVLRAIGNEPDAVHTLPDLENRAPSLVNWVGCHIDASLRSLLARYSDPEARVAGSSTRPGGPPGQRKWTRHWKALSSTGIDLSISLEVYEAEDTIVSACADRAEVMSAEPPWITARRQGLDLTPEQDAAARAYFYEDLISALEAELVSRSAHRGLRASA